MCIRLLQTLKEAWLLAIACLPERDYYAINLKRVLPVGMYNRWIDDLMYKAIFRKCRRIAPFSNSEICIHFVFNLQTYNRSFKFKYLENV
jgi:hypothetical protein